MAMLLEEIFIVRRSIPVYDSNTVSDMEAKGKFLGITLEMTWNSSVYPVYENDELSIAWAIAVAEGWPLPPYEAEMMGKYEHVMRGVVYNAVIQQVEETVETSEGTATTAAIKREVSISCGGLLQKLVGDHQHLHRFTMSSKVYVLIRRISAGADCSEVAESS